MKKIKVIARQRIIDVKTGKIHTDEGLKALNGYYEDIFEIEDTYNQTFFVLQFEENHPEFRGSSFEIIELK